MESFTELLGGRRGAIDSAVPSVAFVAGWLIADQSIRAGWAGTAIQAGSAGAIQAGPAIRIGSVAAIAAAIVVAAIRLKQRRPPRAAALGLLGVLVAVLIVLRTGRAQDFFLIQIVSNAASALAWTVSILIRWPLLGVVVGVVLGQKTRWRRDPALLSAYSRGSWIWVGQYVVRVVVMLPLWFAGATVTLGITRVILTWPLVAACLALSYWVVRQSLPHDHPGLRHPVLAEPTDRLGGPASAADRDEKR